MRRLGGSAVLAVVIILALAMPAMASPLVFPVRVTSGFPQTEPPSVTAASWILYDDTSDMVLASWDADARRPMASVTKIMTVMLALENGDQRDLVTISEEAASVGAQEIGLVAGETLTLGTLVRAAMIHSANDAAMAIAEHIGGSIEGFVKMMNDRAAELGMENTHYANPHGLDARGHYSSPRDMLTLARQAMSMPEFREIVRAKALVMPDSPNGTPRSATNTNRLLNTYDGIIGVKTGETPNAGLTYVGAVERNGRRLYAVVFRSVGRRAHFADAIKLFDWAFDSLRIHGTLTAGIPYQAVAARVEPPLTLQSDTVAPSGSEQPTFPGTQVEEEQGGQTPLAGAVRQRAAEGAPDSFFSTLGYWLTLAFSDG